MKLVSVLALAASAAAFADTGAFYSLQKLPGTFDYITDASDLSQAVEEYTNQLCELGENLVIYRVNSFSAADLPARGNYIKHVHYDSAHDLDLAIGSSCGSSIKYTTQEGTADALVTVVDLESEQDIKLTGKNHVFIQAKPSFRAKQHIKEYIQDQVYDKLNIEFDIKENSKRNIDDESVDVNEEALLEEIEQDFREAESFIAKEGGDKIVTILDTPAAVFNGLVPLKRNSNLFTNYQFFTPGIWLGIIVSFALLSILYVALSWVSSIEITYGAFDKQIDYEKKTE